MRENYRKKLMDKMFDAALKEKLSQLARKYDRELILEIWTEMVKEGGMKNFFGKGEWETSMSLEQALECVDQFGDFIESLIQKRLPEGEGKDPAT